MLVDKGYAGQTRYGITEVVQPYRRGQSGKNAYQKRKHRKRMARRASIEPVIGHLKSDFRMARCYLKGFIGSVLNSYLAAAAWNFRKWILEGFFFVLIWRLWSCLLDTIQECRQPRFA